MGTARVQVSSKPRCHWLNMCCEIVKDPPHSAALLKQPGGSRLPVSLAQLSLTPHWIKALRPPVNIFTKLNCVLLCISSTNGTLWKSHYLSSKIYIFWHLPLHRRGHLKAAFSSYNNASLWVAGEICQLSTCYLFLLSGHFKPLQTCNWESQCCLHVHFHSPQHSFSLGLESSVSERHEPAGVCLEEGHKTEPRGGTPLWGQT